MTTTINLLESVKDNASDQGVEFLDRLIDVLSIGDRFMVRIGPSMSRVSLAQIAVSTAGIGFLGSRAMIPLDIYLSVTDRAPSHFQMVKPEWTQYGLHRPSVAFKYGRDGFFGMVMRDDEIEPGAAMKFAIMDALSRMDSDDPLATLKLSTMAGNHTINQDGINFAGGMFSIPAADIEVPWSSIETCEFEDGLYVAFDDRRRIIIKSLAHAED